MGVQPGASRRPLAGVGPVGPARGQLWAIVLAGGEGMRLRPLTDRICADRRPKQYVPLFEGRSLLEQTLDRVALVVPRTRTAVVTLRSHLRYLSWHFVAAGSPHVLVQPEDRGTAAGVLFPAQWVAWRDPGATVVVFPSDHFVLEEEALMDHVARVAAWAVSQLPGVTWSDLGSPRRVLQVLKKLGTATSWAQESTEEGVYGAPAAAHSPS